MFHPTFPSNETWDDDAGEGQRRTQHADNKSFTSGPIMLQAHFKMQLKVLVKSFLEQPWLTEESLNIFTNPTRSCTMIT